MKVLYLDTRVEAICLHKVGNKIADEGVKLSKKELVVHEDLKNTLLKYFISSFNSEELYAFHHNSDLLLNEVYCYCSGIFASTECIYEQSVNLAKHLYEQSVHPKIKGGEFYVVYFENCMVDGKSTNAIGLFKSENKDTFLKIYSKDDDFEIEADNGININKLDKGCLIFNLEKENGYIVAVVDNTNKLNIGLMIFCMCVQERIALIKPKICFLYVRVLSLNYLMKMVRLRKQHI